MSVIGHDGGSLQRGSSWESSKGLLEEGSTLAAAFLVLRVNRGRRGGAAGRHRARLYGEWNVAPFLKFPTCGARTDGRRVL